MDKLKIFQEKMRSNKDVVSFVLGVISIIIPVIMVATFPIALFKSIFMWIPSLLGVLGLIWGIIIFQKARQLNQDGTSKTMTNKEVSSFILISSSVTILIVNLMLIIMPEHIFTVFFAGVVIGISGLIVGIIELRKIKRLKRAGKDERDKKFALYGVICNAIGILLQIAFVVIIVVLAIAAINLFADFMNGVADFFEGN